MTALRLLHRVLSAVWLGGRDLVLEAVGQKDLYGDKFQSVPLGVGSHYDPRRASAQAFGTGHNDAMHYADAGDRVLGGVVERCLRKWLVCVVAISMTRS